MSTFQGSTGDFKLREGRSMGMVSGLYSYKIGSDNLSVYFKQTKPTHSKKIQVFAIETIYIH